MDLREGSLQFKHALIISKRFSSFWEGYRRAITIFYLIKGPVLLFTTKDHWDDPRYFYSVCAVSLSMLSADIFNLVIRLLTLLMTSCCCCRESTQSKVMGHLYPLSVVMTFY